MRKLITFLIILNTTLISFSQNNTVNRKKVTNASTYKTASLNNSSIKIDEKCGTTEHMEWMMQQDPSLKQKMESEEKKMMDYISTHLQELTNSKTAYTLPVIVHIVQRTSDAQVTNLQVTQQIAQTNSDWAGTNSRSMESFASNPSLKANAQITLCLATKDPNGVTLANPGIHRVTTTTASFSTNDGVKHTSSGGTDAWDVTKYFNIWVCNLGTSIIGYAQFPTSGINSTYGVVIHVATWGLSGTAQAPFNGGGTLSHEGGHCFNLYHIWGDDGGSCSGTDYCTDTPNQASETYGNHSGTLTDACSPSAPGIMYMNFMDYSDDADYANVTPNQVIRMQATVANYLSSLNANSGNLCSVTTSIPTVTTTTATAITSTTATSGGNVTSDGGATVTARGVCWGTSANPIVTGTHTTDGTGTGTFVSSITGLTASTTYHYRAYATNSVGTAYGSDLTFTTSVAGLPTLTTTAASSITNISAVSGGNISSQGGSAVTARGVCWATTSGPIVSGLHTTDGSGIGTFTSNISGLTLGTLYYVRAYATNTSGTAYGNEITFTTTGGSTSTCDTLKAASFTSGTCNLTIYYADANPYDSGYVSGQNAYLDKQKAMLYSGTAGGFISDVYVLYGIKIGTTGSTSVKIYSSNAGVPGTLLGTSATIAKSAIDTTNQGINFNNKYHFSTPIAVGTDFFVSVVLPTGFNNTTNQLAIWSSQYTCSSTSSLAFDMWSDNTWVPFSDPNNWSVNIDMAIFPELCSSVTGVSNIVSSEISVYPNPANNEVFVIIPNNSGEKATVQIFDIYGKLCKQSNIYSSLENPSKISLSDLQTGIYFIQIESEKGIFTKKILVVK